MENIVEQLKQVDFLDIYDEIAELPITDEQVKKICLTVPCKVDLRQVNLLYLVERKYKAKIQKYDKSKVLKWLRVNLPIVLPNPEAKYLRWHKRHQRRVKIDWINRKAEAIQPLPPPICCSPVLEMDNEEDSRCSFVNNTQIDSFTQHSSSTAATIDTVIPSQPKSASQEIMPGFLKLMEASCTSIDSTELPTPILDPVSSTQEMDVEQMMNQNRVEQNENLLKLRSIHRKEPFQQSDEISTQDPYTSFNLDNMVTSTQEFG